MSKTLSIGIPTWNRAAELGDLLQEIASQLSCKESLRDVIEVVISDNGSTDSTAETVEKFIRCNPSCKLTYRRNKINIGFDRNVDNVFHISSGDYVCLISDDDSFAEGAVAQIYRIINETEFSVAYVASNLYSRDMNTCMSTGVAPFFSLVKERRYYKCGGEVLDENGEFYETLVSGQIFNRESWLKINRSPFYETNFIHVYVAALILSSSSVLVVPQPLVKYREGNNGERWVDGETRSVRHLYQHILSAIRLTREYTNRKTYLNIYKRHLNTCRRVTLSERGRKIKVAQLTALRELLTYYDRLLVSFWLIDLPLTLIPSWFLRLGYSLRIKSQGKN